MNVSDLQSLVTAAARFAGAAGANTTVQGKLEGVTTALAPFAGMDLASFAELLRQAEEYHRTGVLPVAATKGRATKPKEPKPPKEPKAPKPPKPTAAEKAQEVERLIRELHALYLVVHEETVSYGAIDEIIESVGRLAKAEVIHVAKGFGLKLATKAGKEGALAEIKRKLIEQKASAERIRVIGQPAHS
jgi:hypothetical protein